MPGEEMLMGRSGIESEKRMMRVIGREGDRGLDILAACCYIFRCRGSLTFRMYTRSWTSGEGERSAKTAKTLYTEYQANSFTCIDGYND